MWFIWCDHLVFYDLINLLKYLYRFFLIIQRVIFLNTLLNLSELSYELKMIMEYDLLCNWWNKLVISWKILFNFMKEGTKENG